MAQHHSKHAEFQAVTANHLGSGAVVYWSREGAWVEAFARAAIAEGADEATALLAQATKGDYEAHVIEPYLFEVVDGVPLSVRETIRAKGPTIHPQFAKGATQ